MSTRFITRVTTVPESFTAKDCGIGYETSTQSLVLIPNPDVKLTLAAQGGTQGTVAGLKVVEDGGLGFHQTKFIFTNMPLTVRNTEQGGGIKIYDFPLGYIYFYAGFGKVTVTTKSVLANTLNASVACKWGVGSLTQSTTSLTTTEQDFIDATAFTSSATIDVANTATTQSMVTSLAFDGTTTATDAFFNISVDAAGDIDGDALVWINGTVYFNWANWGIYSLT